MIHDRDAFDTESRGKICIILELSLQPTMHRQACLKTNHGNPKYAEVKTMRILQPKVPSIEIMKIWGFYSILAAPLKPAARNGENGS